MTAKSTGSGREPDRATALKNWMMIALTSVLALLYSGALLGWIKLVEGERMIDRIEPIIFVILGYYFGRLPSQQNEKFMKEEVGRQTQKADAAQYAKEQEQQTRESLEEKMKNVRAALTSSGSQEKVIGAVKEDALRQSMIAALNILNS